MNIPERNATVYQDNSPVLDYIAVSLVESCPGW